MLKPACSGTTNRTNSEVSYLLSYFSASFLAALPCEVWTVIITVSLRYLNGWCDTPRRFAAPLSEMGWRGSATLSNH